MNTEQGDRMVGYGKMSLYAALAVAFIGVGGCVTEEEDPGRSLEVDVVHETVQLWKDGPYWATMNIGAERPEEIGYHFWWGDTVGYKRRRNTWVASDGSTSGFSFDIDNTPTYGKDNSNLQSEGWITSAGVLAPEHDAAHVHWGGDWRMPTDAELRALMINCDWKWTKRNGVSGYVVRGRGDYASVSIFLPASGYCHGTSLNSVGLYGYYWLSVPCPDIGSDAWILEFNSCVYSVHSYHNRDVGRSVRPLQGFTKQ